MVLRRIFFGSLAEPGQTPGAGLETIASIVQRLGVLLAAGVAPLSAWRYLVEQDAGPTTVSLEMVVAGIGEGKSVEEAIFAVTAPHSSPHAAAWRGLAAAWSIAGAAGASLAPSLQYFADCLRSLAQTQRNIVGALAAPAMTARVVLLLPVIGMLFSLTLGFDTLRTLFGTPLGLACCGAGTVLVLLARAWSRSLVRRAEPTLLTPGLALDLTAIAVSGGASTENATAAVIRACHRFGIATDESDEVIAGILALSRRAGVPAAALLRSEAEEIRRLAMSEGQRKAATLSVTLMLPLGLCILPSFMLLGVVPLVITVISSTARSF